MNARQSQSFYDYDVNRGFESDVTPGLLFVLMATAILFQRRFLRCSLEVVFLGAPFIDVVLIISQDIITTKKFIKKKG